MSKKCKTLLIKYQLFTREDAKEWIIANHPDKKDHPKKDANLDPEDYKKDMPLIKECITDENIFDNLTGKKIKVTKKNRAKIFSCMRKTANFSKISNYHKFDKSSFSPQ